MDNQRNTKLKLILTDTKIIIAIISLTILEITAIENGVNGHLFAFIICTITSLATGKVFYEYGKRNNN